MSQRGPYPPVPSVVGVAGASQQPPPQIPPVPPEGLPPGGFCLIATGATWATLQSSAALPPAPVFTQPYAPQPGMPSYETDTSPTKNHEYRDDTFIQEIRGRRIMMILNAVLAVYNFVIWMLYLAAILNMSCACGMGGVWLVSLVPILVGGIVGGLVVWILLYLFLLFFPSSQRNTERKFWATFFGWVWAFCVVIACGIPFAMTCGQFHDADDIVQTTKQKEINCWKNPNDIVTADKINFITRRKISGL